MCVIAIQHLYPHVIIKEEEKASFLTVNSPCTPACVSMCIHITSPQISTSYPIFPLQDPGQPGLQQHCHTGGSQETRLSPKPGEAAFKEQHHPTAELTAAADARHERIADIMCSQYEAKTFRIISSMQLSNQKHIQDGGFTRPYISTYYNRALCTDVQYIYFSL